MASPDCSLHALQPTDKRGANAVNLANLEQLSHGGHPDCNKVGKLICIELNHSVHMQRGRTPSGLARSRLTRSFPMNPSWWVWRGAEA